MTVPGPSVEFTALVASLGPDVAPEAIGQALLDAFADLYTQRHGACALHEFEQSGGHYLFDLASSADLPQEDRTVGAWALTPESAVLRDKAYQRGFPMTPGTVAPVDRGHLIPHVSGGQFGPNIFRQDTALNRGRSERGKRYRAIERAAARVPGTLFFGHLLYGDDTAYPVEVEIGYVRDGELRAERFDNRPT